MIHERPQSVPMTNSPSFSKGEQSGARANKKKGKAKGFTIPPRGALPDGSFVDFGHGNNSKDSYDNKDNNRGRKATHHGNKADVVDSTTADLKNLLISATDNVETRGGTRSAQGSSHFNPASVPSLPDGAKPDFGNGNSNNNNNKSRKNGRSSRSRSRSHSHSRSNSPPLSASSSSLNLSPPQTSAGYAGLRVPPVQALPDGSRPNFGGPSPSASSGTSVSFGPTYPYKHLGVTLRKPSNSTSTTSYSNDSLLDSNQIYAGSSFHSSPSAVSLPKPSFSKR
ncbi:DEKNAAC104038 [Brettanomyces naardenensis]|uniref:DEKNAAC104038 n=1 Tax=Brettanomyces naardenensis TaxID=13370 RepID=A0A448YQ37_BRENA|nr:DEKNAAC104038 [Brettanomyces naardenensis]